jgi:hypothetical protein
MNANRQTGELLSYNRRQGGLLNFSERLEDILNTYRHSGELLGSFRRPRGLLSGGEETYILYTNRQPGEFLSYNWRPGGPGPAKFQ